MVGTPPNIIVSGTLSKFGIEPFGFFEFAWIGIPLTVATIVFMMLVGKHLLPKHEITDADIRALVAGTNVENPEGFHFQDLRLTTNPDETITAAVSLVNEDGEAVEFLANGQGSVEAIFNAIDKFFNQTVRLISYNIDAITDGIDAQARVLVSVENVDTDTIFNASGLDFDVLKASAIAYINANTLVQKENAGEMARKVSYRDLPQT